MAAGSRYADGICATELFYNGGPMACQQVAAPSAKLPVSPAEQAEPVYNWRRFNVPETLMTCN